MPSNMCSSLHFAPYYAVFFIFIASICKSQMAVGSSPCDILKEGPYPSISCIGSRSRAFFFGIIFFLLRASKIGGAGTPYCEHASCRARILRNKSYAILLNSSIVSCDCIPAQIVLFCPRITRKRKSISMIVLLTASRIILRSTSEGLGFIS